MDLRTADTSAIQKRHDEIEQELTDLETREAELAQMRPKNWRDYSIREQQSELYRRRAEVLREHILVTGTLESRGAAYACKKRSRR